MGKNLMFVTVGGSHAYGYAKEYSDVHLCGCAMNTASDILGTTRFDSYRDKQTRTTIHGFQKAVELLLAGDIATTEMLYLERQNYALLSPLGQALLKNRELFLSQRVSDSYAGYIFALTQWLDTLQSRINLGRSASEKKIFSACEPIVKRFNKQFQKAEKDAVRLYLAPSTLESLPRELHVDMQIKGCPLRQLLSVCDALNNTVQNYETKAVQRRAVDAPLIAQKTATLVRMLYTCCDLLETGTPVVRRTQENALLVSLRNGEFVTPNCKIKDELYDLVNPLLRRLEQGRANTLLPKEPDEAAVNAFVMELNRKAIRKPRAPKPAE